MKSKNKKIGPFLKLSSDTNTDLPVTKVRGVSTSKQLIKTKANLKDVDISDYKVVRRGQFVYTPDTSRRGDKIALALNSDEDVLVSKIYPVFEIVNEEQLLPEFLFLWFKRPEFDRYARFHSWGSARETFDWTELCNVEIPFPDINLQKLIVNLYSEMLKKQKTYENSLNDLQLICDVFITDLAKKRKLELLGQFIDQSQETNYGLSLDKVRGVSIQKTLIKPKANMTDVDLSDYKLLKRNEFVFNPNTARMGEKIPIALNSEEDYLVSKIYPVFYIKSEDELLPEYLLLWFKRSDFDRYARFHSWGSARETFNWDDMCNVKLPIPDITVQRSIVNLYHALESRKKICRDLAELINEMSSILMKGVV